MLIDILPIDNTVGDIEDNREKILSAFQSSAEAKAALLVTPECALSGYPPEDLVLRPAFMQEIQKSVDEIISISKNYDTALLLGTPWIFNNDIINAALFIQGGCVTVAAAKQILPNFGVFDDPRTFKVHNISQPILVNGKKFGVMICEDMWHISPSQNFVDMNCDGIISINASPFEKNKHNLRLDNVQKRTAETQLPFLAVFNIGAQDHIIYDGRTFAMNKDGVVTAQSLPFDQNKLRVNFDKNSFIGDIDNKKYTSEELVYSAIMHGLRNYISKNNFKKIVIGLSGGVDSVLSCAVAVDAIGAENVTAILLPSQYTSEESFKDAYDTIEALGIEHHVISIKEGICAIESTFEDIFAGLETNITEENLQSRLRGLYLMAYSNKFGHMVLTTGNKSEMAVGYATLYGDMCGGYNALKDIYKTEVYRLCHYRNKAIPMSALGSKAQIIPDNVIKKPPTAELRPDQKDSDSLPDYDILDDILEKLIEHDMSVSDIVKFGHDKTTVQRIWHLVNISEYKRRQSAPGAKVSTRSFDRDRRYPITNAFRD